jgi:hypothetical protein
VGFNVDEGFTSKDISVGLFGSAVNFSGIFVGMEEGKGEAWVVAKPVQALINVQRRKVMPPLTK